MMQSFFLADFSILVLYFDLSRGGNELKEILGPLYGMKSGNASQNSNFFRTSQGRSGHGSMLLLNLLNKLSKNEVIVTFFLSLSSLSSSLNLSF